MNRPPLLLAGHGTRDPAGVAAFTAFTTRLQARFAPQGIDVTGGFIELSAPPLRDAVTELTGRGHRRVVAVPLVLSAASHAKSDIPAALARERARHPGLDWSYGRPLGPHPVLLDLLAARIAEQAGQMAEQAGRMAEQAGRIPGPPGPAPTGTAPPGPPPAVLLVARGSTDPDANAEICKTARLLWEGRDFAFAETAFVSLASPDVPAGLERCRLLGASRVIVARYFLFPGILPDRIAAQATAYGQAHPDLDVRCTEVLGDSDELAGLVAERYHEALAGDIRMNCDVCAYRTALPGFEYRVGAAQRPHAHPHDDGHVHVH
jgi:sirohydrochlorin cobaltochelatase